MGPLEVCAPEPQGHSTSWTGLLRLSLPPSTSPSTPNPCPSELCCSRFPSFSGFSALPASPLFSASHLTPSREGAAGGVGGDLWLPKKPSPCGCTSGSLGHSRKLGLPEPRPAAPLASFLPGLSLLPPSLLPPPPPTPSPSSPHQPVFLARCCALVCRGRSW